MERSVVTCTLVFAVALTSCGYDAKLSDCTISCSEISGCPANFTCSTSEGLCRSGETTASCAAVASDGGIDSVVIDVIDATPPITFAPSNLGTAAGDLQAGTLDLVLQDATIDTDAATITNVPLGSNDTRVQVQIAPAPSITVFRFH